SYNTPTINVISTKVTIRDMGKNSVQLIPVSQTMLVFYAQNFDGEKTTKVTYAVGKGDSLSQEDIQKYEEVNNERGIPNENTEDGAQTDNCPK
ncbi:hypothetical protein FD755_015846, partial [Muntiacus reevesi]